MLSKAWQSYEQPAVPMMFTFGLILTLLLAGTLADYESEPIFKAVGEEMEIGFCFGVDYIALFRITEEGKQLVGNSSNPFSSLEAYKHRIKAIHSLGLLGMKVGKLRISDSGVYTSECWRDNELVNYHAYHLYVCDKQISSQKILFVPNYGADLECAISNSGQDSTSIIWFRKSYPSYKPYLLLDTRNIQEPLQEELKDLIQVQNRGYSLHISEVTLKSNHNFTCLVFEAERCKGFQNMYLPVEVFYVYYGAGEKAVLSCGSEHLNQKQTYWKTPFGEVNSTTLHENKGTVGNQVSISNAEESGNYSLVIPVTTHNHSGEYMCLSVQVLKQYFVAVCSELKTDEIQFVSGGIVTLDCTLNTTESTNIQWFCQRDRMEISLIYDSGDPSVIIPEDISDRLHISEPDRSIIISELTDQDSGTYWCVVLLETNKIFEYHTGNVDDEYNWADEEENTDMCTLKRVIQLKSQSINSPKFIPDLNVESVPKQDPNPESPSDSKPGAETKSSPLPYAVIGGILVIVILMLIVLGAVKMKAKRKELSSSRVEPHQENTSAPLMSLRNLPRNSEDLS